MEIKELRITTGLSQAEFSKKFGIPVSTIKNWEQGQRKPPKYLVSMMQQLLKYEAAVQPGDDPDNVYVQPVCCPICGNTVIFGAMNEINGTMCCDNCYEMLDDETTDYAALDD